MPNSPSDRQMPLEKIRSDATRGTVVLRRLGIAAAMAAFALMNHSVEAADKGNWVPTWTASAQPSFEPTLPMPTGLPPNLWNQTIRQNASLSIGGSRVRVVLSNEYGSQPLTIGAAQIAVSEGGPAIQASSSRPLTFGGRSSITIPPGAPVISDPVDLAIRPLEKVAVDLFFPDVSPTTTMHWDSRQTTYVVAGNKVGEAKMTPVSTHLPRLFLTEILVDAPTEARAIVTFGDSITDGDGSTLDADHRWPDRLAERLAKAGGAPVAVLNQGISGARVLTDGMGVNALARFERDVLSQHKADTVVVMMGINDIGWPGCGWVPNDPQRSADEIIGGYQQLISRAHLRGMRIIGATLTPFGNTGPGTILACFYNEEKEKVRKAVNEWIRTSGQFDGVVDFDAALDDPKNPGHLLPAYDKGDHLHPSDAGYEAMAAAVDLKILLGQ